MGLIRAAKQSLAPNYWANHRQTAIDLYRSGLSAGQTAAQLPADAFGTKPTRNAVMGIVSRAGVQVGLRQMVRPKLPKAPPQPTQSGSSQPTPIVRPGSLAAQRREARALEPLGPPDQFPERGLCQFTTDDPAVKGWRMCGRLGSPWCEAHKVLVWDKTNPITDADKAAAAEADRESGSARAFG